LGSGKSPGAAKNGNHERATYLALVYGLLQASRSGILEVKARHHWRRVFLLGGSPIWFESSLESESLGQTLVAAGLVAKGQVEWLTSKLSPGEDLRDALVMSGSITAEGLEAHLQSQIERGYAAPLSWARGKWTFDPCDALDSASIDPALIGDVAPLRALWQGVQQQVEMDQVLEFVSDPGAGVLTPSQGFEQAFPGLEVDEPFGELPGCIGDATTVEELFRKIPDRSGNLMKLLWLLEVVGLVRREGRSSPDVLALIDGWVGERHGGDERISFVDEAPPEPPPPPPSPAPPRAGASGASKMQERAWSRESLAGDSGAYSSTSSVTTGNSWSAMESSLLPGHPGENSIPPGEITSSRWSTPPAQAEPEPRRSPGEIAELLRTAHGHRMGKDYYAFLGVESSASLKEIRRAYKRLAKHWKAAATTDGLPEEALGMARDLSTAARRVWQTMSDQTLRQAYNRRLAQGSAPLVQGASRKPSPAAREAARKAPRRRSAATRGNSEAWEEAYDQARKLMEDGDFDRALTSLERARRENPSSPDVLAELGWCTWMIRGFTPDSAEAAEEFLRLATAFDARHLRSLECLARIASKLGDTDATQARLRLLLKVSPDHAWARRELGKSPAGDDGDDQATGGRLRFWRKNKKG
jgi:curved DNA-binding protein CbpA